MVFAHRGVVTSAVAPQEPLGRIENFGRSSAELQRTLEGGAEIGDMLTNHDLLLGSTPLVMVSDG